MEKQYLAISVVAGLIYLVKTIDLTKKSKERFWLEAVMFTFNIVVGFVAISTTIFVIGLSSKFYWMDKNDESK